MYTVEKKPLLRFLSAQIFSPLFYMKEQLLLNL